MKKLLFGLIATVMFGFVGNAQTFERNKSNDRTFRLVNVIALLESKTQFETSKSENEFVVKMTKGVTDTKYIEILTPYLKEVYSMHTAKYTQDNAYDKVNFDLYYSTFNSVAKYSLENPKALVSLNNAKINWLNLIRKIIDIIDDALNGGK